MSGHYAALYMKVLKTYISLYRIQENTDQKKLRVQNMKIENDVSL